MATSSSSSSSAAAEPEIRIVAPSAICSLGMRPYLMTGFLRQHFIEHFKSPDGIELKSLREYLWTPEVTTSKILIESVTRWTPETAGARPAIIIKRNAWRVLNLGINNQMQGSWSIDGYDRHSVFMQGSHTLFCLTGEGGECERLAFEVYRELIQFGPLIRRTMDLKKFVVVEVGPVARVDESAAHWVVPVTVAYVGEEAWTLKQHAPKLKRIYLKDLEP